MAEFSRFEYLLAQTLSTDQRERTTATETLEKECRSFQGMVFLAQYIARPVSTPDITFHQYSALLLKKAIKESWENGGTFILQDTERDQLRQLLLTALSSSTDNKLQTAIIMSVSLVAETDFPEKWPELWTFILQMIESSAEDHSIIAIKSLAIMVHHFNNQHIPNIASSLFPHLLRHFEASALPADVRTKIIYIVRNCLEILSIMAQAGETDAIQTISSDFNQWISAFIKGLTEEVTSVAQYGVKIEIFRALAALIMTWPKQMSQVIPLVLPHACRLLDQGIGMYQELNLAILDEKDVGSAVEYGDDGDFIGLSPMFIQIFEFTSILVQLRSKAIRRIIGPIVGKIGYCLVAYAQLTNEQISEWNDDPNQYMIEEDDESMECNVRNSALNLLKDFEANRELDEAVSLLEAAATRLYENREDWRMQESAMFALGTLSKTILSLQTASKTIQAKFNIPNLLEYLLGVLSKPPSVYAYIRSIWCGGKILELLSEEQASHFVRASLSGLDESQPLLVRLYACRCICLFASNCRTKYLIDTVVAVNRLLVLTNSMTPGTLPFLLDALILLLQENCNFKIVDTGVFHHLLKLLENYTDDPFVSERIHRLIGILLDDRTNFDNIQERLMPIILSILTQKDGVSSVLESGLEFLEALLVRSGSPLLPSYFTAILEHLLSVLLATDDSNVLFVGVNCIRQYLNKGADQLRTWTSAQGQPGIDCILEVANRLFQPGVDESITVKVGGLITQLVLQLSSYLPVETTNSILAAVVNRLYVTESLDLILALILVFARLIHAYDKAVIDLLDTMESPSNSDSSALQLVILKWVRWQPDFYGSFTLKITILALMKLMFMRDPRLENLEVAGDIILDASNRRITRSQKRQSIEQFSRTTFSTRVLTLVVRAIPSLLEEERAEWVSSDESSEDEGEPQFLSDALESEAFFDPAPEIGYDIALEDARTAENDPLYSVDMKVELARFFQNLGPQAILLSQLLPADQKTLKNFVGN